MDKHELVKTVITIVLTVIAKECFSWLVSWLKKIVSRTDTNAIAKAIIARRNRITIFFDLFALSVAIYVLFDHAKKNHPLNQWEVVFICLYTVNFLFWGASLFGDSRRALEDWVDRKDRKQLAKEG